MAKRLHVPETPILTSDGTLSPIWQLFFEKISKYLEIMTKLEIGTGGPEVNGNYRVIQSGNNLVHQRRESGSWVTKHTISP